MINCSHAFRKDLYLLFVVLFFSCRATRTPVTAVKVTPQDTVWRAANITAFEKKIAWLQEHYHIPGISVGIVNGHQLAWRKGFGYADREHQVIPDENTIYQVASVTKTFGSIILMQQVEAGKVSLDDPISKYKINLGARWGSDPKIKIKHLLTHTAMGTTLNGFKPGYKFRYNGAWYNQLDKVIQQASGESFGELLMKEIVVPLSLKNTAPSTDDSLNFALTGYDKATFMQQVAKPYDWQHRQMVPVTFSYGFGPAAGIMSTVADLGIYSNAIDDGKFLQDTTWKKVFTPYVTPKGKRIQYGLGWFIGRYKGIKVVWHTGWWTGYSALFVKVPEKDLTFIVLANSQDLSRPFYHLMRVGPMGFYRPFKRNLNKHLDASDFAKAFLEHFVE
ncbi:MAG: beta-lactamase family protein [Chitinophaga sp.]|uniref:serine hydrolase domain-containing protein n=1 Tax=Chitinophaga sp. TaxID=1869181 RepID=UPI001B1631AB|nr:serine hydrolase domain-containing protein [Chitinophaga sp.]MBO9732561.1 beta-lactamase family protein [Chitinophaga sp.]